MADNTTTYTTIVDVNVKGQGEIEQLNQSVDDSGTKFVSLRRQIRETTVELQSMADKGQDNSTQFRELSEHLKELQVQQKKVAFEAKNTTDKLAELPGPLGNIGKGLKDAKESMEVFGKSTYVALGVVGLVIGAFVAMKEALSKTQEGQETLSKVSEAFGKVMAPIFALLEKVGIPIFEALAKYLEWFADKVTKVVEFLGIAKGKVQEIATEGNKAFYDKAQEDLDNMKKVQDIIKQQQEEAHRKAEEANRKHLERLAEQERLAREKEKEELAKQLEITQRLRDAMKNVAYVVGSDGMTDKERQAAYKAEEERRKWAQEKQKQLTLDLEQNIASGRIKLAQTTALQLEALEKTNAKQKLTVEQWLNSEKARLIQDNLNATRAALNLAGNLMDKNSDGFKAVAIAQTTIDTYQSATAAYKAVVGIPIVGPALAVVAAAAAVAGGLMNVKAITSTPVPKISTDGGGGGSAASAAANIPVPAAPTFTMPDLNVTGGANPTSQIAQTLASASNKPVQAYVVSSAVTSQQALDRRTNAAATFTAA